MNSLHRTLILTLLLIPLSPAQAELHSYTFDKVHTQILFFVNHLGFSNSQGEFHDYDGSFSFDPEAWERSAVEVTIRTASIDMDDQAWDDHMRNEDFFDVTRFPTMTFRSTKVEQTEEKRGYLHGDLTLLGVTKPVSLELQFNRIGVHPFNKKTIAGFSAEGIVKRSEFGMSYAVPFVSDEVQLRIEVEGYQQ